MNPRPAEWLSAIRTMGQHRAVQSPIVLLRDPIGIGARDGLWFPLIGGPGMKTIDRITFDPEVMGGKPCIRGMRVTVGMIVGLVAAGRTRSEIPRLYPYLGEEDITQALTYAAWRAEEFELPLVPA